MRGIGAKLIAWKARHSLLFVAGLIGLIALLAGAGYQAGWYFWARGHFRSARQAVNRYAWAEANDHVSAALRGWPRDPSNHLLAARVARRLERLEEAEAHLEECQRLEGITRESALESVLLEAQRGEVAGVERELQTQVDRGSPDTQRILEALAQGYINTYRLDGAMYCLERLLEREPRELAS